MNQPETLSEDVTIDREHAMQVGLLDLLGQAIADGKPDSEKLEILDQLLSFSDVHFMSEQLMMRQYSYEGYDKHVVEHDTMVDALRALKAAVTQDPSEYQGPQIAGLRGLLLKHIALEDRQFADFLQSRKSPRP